MVSVFGENPSLLALGNGFGSVSLLVESCRSRVGSSGCLAASKSSSPWDLGAMGLLRISVADIR